MTKLEDNYWKRLCYKEQELQKLQQENKQLKECYCNRTDCIGRIKDSRKYDSVKQQLDKSNSILTEFEKTLNSYDLEYLHTMGEHLLADNIEHLKNKIQELKEKYK